MTYIKNLISKIKLIVDNNSNPLIYKDYRYGDVVYRKGWKPHYNEWKVLCKSIMSNANLKNSFLYIYLTQYQSPEENNTIIHHPEKFHTAIDEIYDKLQILCPDTFLKPEKHELVIQLRLGDVIEHDWYLKKDYIHLIQQFVSKFEIKKISFVTAFFFANVTTNTNKQIFMYSEQKLKDNKIKVEKLLKSVHEHFPDILLHIVSNYNPDVDMFYLLHANHLITETGGFGDFAKKVRQNAHDI